MPPDTPALFIQHITQQARVRDFHLIKALRIILKGLIFKFLSYSSGICFFSFISM